MRERGETMPSYAITARTFALLLATTALVPCAALAQQPPATTPPAANEAPAPTPAPATNPPSQTQPASPSAPTAPAETPAVNPPAAPTVTSPPAASPAPPPAAQTIPPVVVQSSAPRPAPPAPRQPATQRSPAPARSTATTTTAAANAAAAAAANAAAVGNAIAAANAVPIKERYQLPQTTASITAAQIEQKINIVDTEDALKYMPSLFVRKRNAGDNQAVLASRVWGINASARTLIYVDDILISNLQGNNNSNASPRWGLVSPEEIKRIDFLYGPFAAMYPGNSMGGVLQITTRTPDKFETTFKQSESFQGFSYYNTKDTYRTDQSAATIGNRWGDLSAFFAINQQTSNSQPLGWATATAAATAGLAPGTTGVILQPNRTGGIANVLGAIGLLHTDQINATGKAVLDITPWLQASYVTGLWSNDQTSRVESYLRDAAGNPTFGGQTAGSPFASSNYTLEQMDLANAFTLKSDTGGKFDGEIVVSRMDYLKDIQRSPFAVTATGMGFISTGRIARLDGTNWTTFDARAFWRPMGKDGPHEITFGYHADLYVLNNPTYRTTTWYSGPDSTNQLYTRGDGKTETTAAWLQEVWRFAPLWKLTLGGRWEDWRAFDGYNLSTTTTATGAGAGNILTTSAINQPTLSASRFSPKASVSFEPNKMWIVTASYGVANRFPTVTELYQSGITAAGITVFPNPNLAPERSLASELAIERRFIDGKVRLSLFHEDTKDLLIAQTIAVANIATPTSVTTNVDRVRNRGVELAWQKDNVLIERLEPFGSVTYVDSRILSDPTFIGTNGSTAEGKRVPYVPMWRTTLGATYHPGENWSYTVAMRYQSKVYATLDNTDYVTGVYQAFDPFVVADVRIQYKAGENGSIAFGIDNIGNYQYHLFHPFPQRTYVVQGRLKY